jgi:transmembrane sensor
MPQSGPSETKREEAIDWILRLRDTPDDTTLRSEFEHWLASDPAHKNICQRVQCLMGDTGKLLSNDAAFLHRALQNNKAYSSAKKTGLALLAVIFAGSFFLLDGPMRLRADVMSRTAERRAERLPDGSMLYLNANSAVSFRFDTKERRVVLLRGEVYAEVSNDPIRPFVVEAQGGTTTALGTAFDVNLISSQTYVTVTEHSVAVENGHAGDVRIGENQRVSYGAGDMLGVIEAIDATAAASWRNGRLVFEDRTFGFVVEEIARYLPGRVVIARDIIRNKHVSGNFDLSEPQSALRDLGAAFDVKVTRIGPFLTILH